MQSEIKNLDKYTPDIELLDMPEYPKAFDKVTVEDGYERESVIKDRHDELLSYLLHRLNSDTNRDIRAKRFGNIDHLISTHQKLSKDDSVRREKENTTGRSQATAMNMPMIHTHVDDMVSFFAEIYSPAAGAFFVQPQNQAVDEAMRGVLDLMNEDAAVSEYYTQITAGLRALIKYNVGGFHREWNTEDLENDSENTKEGMNWVHSLDMYNVMWDQSVSDPKNIRREGEWWAEASVVNRMHLVRRAQAGIYAGVECVLDAESADHKGTGKATFYRHPPTQANVQDEDSTTGVSGVDWTQFNRQFTSEGTELKDGYEIVNMYCWLNPADFDLTYDDKLYTEDGYFLWRFKILNGKQIIFAEPVNKESDSPTDQGKTVIPVYMGYLNRDDMKAANRSIAELLAPFQRFTSFLMNAHVAGVRNSIWGIKTFDPQMFDMSALDSSEGTVAYLESKAPGRDVRTGLQELKGTFDGTNTLSQVTGVMQIAQQFFPAQALPGQVAGIDRAVTNQVTAVMQGVSRRLHMLVKTCDESIFNAMRFDMYRSMIESEKVKADGITDRQARKALGSGLAMMHRELAEQAIRQIFMAMLQNPTIVEQYDLDGIYRFWASMQAFPLDLNQFKLQKQPTAPAPTAQTEPAPPADSLAGIGQLPVM